MGAPKHIEVIARGVLRHGSAVLACRSTAGGFLYLPGGHVEPGEPAARALEREFEEETGLGVRTGPCVLVSEGLFEERGKQHHELNLVFHVELRPGSAAAGLGPDDPPPPVHPREKGIAFEWTDLASVTDLDLRPEPIRAWLVSGGATQGGPTCTWIGVDGDHRTG